MNENVEIFKLVFESEEGKKWFTQYLTTNLQLQCSNQADGFLVSIVFNATTIASRRLFIHTNPTFTSI